MSRRYRDGPMGKPSLMPLMVTGLFEVQGGLVATERWSEENLSPAAG